MTSRATTYSILLCLAACTAPEDIGRGAQVNSPTAYAEGSYEAEAELGNVRNIREFHWGASKNGDAVSVRLPMSFAERVECELMFAHVGKNAGPGNKIALHFEYADGKRLVAVGSGGLAVYSDQVDYRVALGNDHVGYRVPVRLNGRFKEGIVFTFVVKDPAVIEQNFIPGHSLAASISCDGDFSIIGAQMGDGGELADLKTLEGNGAVLGPALDATVEGHLTMSAYGDTAGVFLNWGGNNIGNFELHHPQGVESFPFEVNGDAFETVDSGPGLYHLRTTRVEDLTGRWSVVLYDLQYPLNLLEGRKPSSIIFLP